MKYKVRFLTTAEDDIKIFEKAENKAALKKYNYMNTQKLEQYTPNN